MTDGNPMRKTIEEAAHLVGTCFILNLILDRDKRIVDAVVKDMIKAHRDTGELRCPLYDTGVGDGARRVLAQICLKSISEQIASG